ncbi:MAG TPA: calcium-binding protein [Solirubrobacter sp.]|nr:calcium-binding protein [Solirubrobacter sp.]
MSIMRYLAPIAALAAALALPPAMADAAELSYAGGDHGAVVYAAGPGEALDTVVGYEPACIVAGGVSYDCVTFSGDAITAAPSQCAAVAGSESCVLDTDHSGVRIAGGDGDDDVSVLEADIGGFPGTTAYAIAIDGGAGNDVVDGGSAAEMIHGESGADRLGGRGGSDALDGGDGNDTLLGDGFRNGNESPDGGDDRLSGGAGDDTLSGDAYNDSARIGHDTLDGGPGTDTIEQDWYRFDGHGGDQDPAPTVSFDGIANDGRPGENDDVTGIERIESGVPAGTTPSTFAGDDGPNTFDLLFTNGVVRAGGGDDTITGSDYADALDGGPGDDHISGGFGDDTITGGPGADDIGGDRSAACFYGPIFGGCTIGSGNDTIYAQDGERDAVDCGPGADTAFVDAVDVVAGCEVVNAAPGGGTAPAPGGGGSVPTTVSPPAATIAVRNRHLRSIARSRALRVVCRLRGPGRCAVRAAITARDARKLHLKPRRRTKTYMLGTARRTLEQAGKATLRIRLARKLAKALRHRRSLRVTFTITATYATGHRTTTQRVALRH